MCRPSDHEHDGSPLPREAAWLSSSLNWPLSENAESSPRRDPGGGRERGRGRADVVALVTASRLATRAAETPRRLAPTPELRDDLELGHLDGALDDQLGAELGELRQRPAASPAAIPAASSSSILCSISADGGTVRLTVYVPLLVWSGLRGTTASLLRSRRFAAGGGRDRVEMHETVAAADKHELRYEVAMR
jgi:hypothetical protein